MTTAHGHGHLEGAPSELLARASQRPLRVEEELGAWGAPWAFGQALLYGGIFGGGFGFALLAVHEGAAWLLGRFGWTEVAASRLVSLWVGGPLGLLGFAVGAMVAWGYWRSGEGALPRRERRALLGILGALAPTLPEGARARLRWGLGSLPAPNAHKEADDQPFLTDPALRYRKLADKELYAELSAAHPDAPEVQISLLTRPDELVVRAYAKRQPKAWEARWARDPKTRAWRVADAPPEVQRAEELRELALGAHVGQALGLWLQGGGGRPPSEQLGQAALGRGLAEPVLDEPRPFSVSSWPQRPRWVEPQGARWGVQAAPWALLCLLLLASAAAWGGGGWLLWQGYVERQEAYLMVVGVLGWAWCILTTLLADRLAQQPPVWRRWSASGLAQRANAPLAQGEASFDGRWLRDSHEEARIDLDQPFAVRLYRSPEGWEQRSLSVEVSQRQPDGRAARLRWRAGAAPTPAWAALPALDVDAPWLDVQDLRARLWPLLAARAAAWGEALPELSADLGERAAQQRDQQQQSQPLPEEVTAAKPRR